MTKTPRCTPAKNTTRKKAAASAGHSGANENPELAESPDIGTAINKGLTFGPKAVQYAVVDGRAIFEGDIDLGSVEEIFHRRDFSYLALSALLDRPIVRLMSHWDHRCVQLHRVLWIEQLISHTIESPEVPPSPGFLKLSGPSHPLGV